MFVTIRTACLVSLQQKQMTVNEVIKDVLNRTTGEVLLSAPSVTQHLKELVKKGMAKKGEEQRPARYELTDEGTRAAQECVVQLREFTLTE